MANPFRAKPLTNTRIGLAIAVAVVADGLQLMSGPPGWVGFVQTVDVIAMIITCALLGFHPLLLPTFVVELFPIMDMLPTWTGCVGAVIFLRKRAQSPPPPVINTAGNPPTATPARKMPEPTGPVIDV